jgi:pantothenate kinase
VHDPEEDKIAIAPTHKIVVVEGNYLTLPDAPWSELHSGDAPLLDEIWHLDCSVDDAMARVTRRHVAVGRSAEEARRKVDGNDRPNGELVCSRKGVADVLVPSYEWEGK